MNSGKILFVMTLLMLTGSAWGIEVEPNNDSAHANPLGTENVGQLNQGSDVDFFSIVNSCVTYTTDDEKLDFSGKTKAGTCAKYTVDDLTAVPPQKIGDIKYRSEISLAFSCDSRAATAITGWYLGILDANGILQNTYQVQPSECMVGASGSQGPYSFKFSTLSSDNTLKPNSKYYLSVVADCHLPIYSIPQTSNPVIGVNTLVQSTPATQVDIDAAKAEIVKAENALQVVKQKLSDADTGNLVDSLGNVLADYSGNKINFSVTNSNASVAQASDALLASNDIVKKAETDLATGITTAATTINAVSSTAKAVKIMSDALRYSVQTHSLFLVADAAAKNPAVQKAIDYADIEVDKAANAVKLADAEVTKADAAVSTADANVKSATNPTDKATADTSKITADAAKKVADDNKTAADAAKFAADNAKKVAQATQAIINQTQLDTKADDTDATTKLDKANIALSDTITILNTTVSADIAASNAATSSGSRTNNACPLSNTATYTIKDNQDNSPKITPYLDIAAKNPPALGLQSSQQTGSAYDVDFFTVTGDPSTEIPLEFSCTKNNAKGSTEGWVVSAWASGKDKPEFAYQISPQDCDPANPYALKLPKFSGNYYVGVQSACALAPTDKSSILQLIYYNTSGNATNSTSNYLCDINTASFTIKQGETTNALDLTNLTTSNQLVTAQKGKVKTATASNLYYVDSANAKNDIPLLFACTKDAKRFTNDWKLSIYNEAKVLLSSQLINGSACGEGLDGDTGSYKFTLPSGSSRYYLSVSSACANAGDKTCQLDTSEYTISRDVITAPATTTPKIETVTPYLDISGKSPSTLKVQTRGRLNNLKSPNFYSLASSPSQDIPLEFSCDKSKAIGNNFGWVMTVWEHDNADNTKTDLLEAAYEIQPTDCDSSTTDATYKVTVPSSSNVTYIGVQSICLPVPTENKSALAIPTTTDCKINTGYYTLKSNVVVKDKLTDSNLKSAIALGSDKSGQINSIDDNDIYAVESDGSAEIPLIFSCSSMAMRQTNDWKISIYNDANDLVSSQFVNGSDCGSGFIGDKGGYAFSLPKGSPNYYLSVKSACGSLSKKDCIVDTAEYNISRGATKVYTGKLLSSNKKLTSKSANLKLTYCGLNNNATITVNAANIDLSKAVKSRTLPVKIQIGSMACQILTTDTSSVSTSNAISGNFVSPTEIIDSNLIAKDTANITLTDCGSSNSKVTLTGSKLDLENLNPASQINSVVIPVKVSIGDFNCEAKDAFYITTDTDTTYNIVSPAELAASVTQPSDTSPTDTQTGTSTVDQTVPDGFEFSWLVAKKNLGAFKTGQIKSLTDAQIYQVDTGTMDANLTFSCVNSVRYQNDWKVLIYDSTQALKAKTLINGSSCGIGQQGDTGAYSISLPKISSTYYLVVKSACDSTDTTCTVDSSQYQINRVFSNATTVTPTTCLIGSCLTSTVTPFFQ